MVRFGKYVDVAAGALGWRRPVVGRLLCALLTEQGSWEPSIIVGHNLPQLIPLVDPSRHTAVLYAHNLLFGTYTARETRRVLRDAPVIVAVSRFLADELRARLPEAWGSRVAVVPNAVDLDLFGAPPRDRDDRLRILFVGRTIPEKGPHILVDAFRRMRHRTAAELTIVGSTGFSACDPLTSFERRLRQQAAGMPVTFKPFMPRAEVAREMRRSDVLVVPSTIQEAFGLTVLEGMASGLAVVASRVGGVPEALDGAGLDFAPGDSDELAAILDSLADDETLRFEWATKGYVSAQRRDWTAAADALARALVI